GMLNRWLTRPVRTGPWSGPVRHDTVGIASPLVLPPRICLFCRQMRVPRTGWASARFLLQVDHETTPCMRSACRGAGDPDEIRPPRSEEHTSELQSRENL